MGGETDLLTSPLPTGASSQTSTTTAADLEAPATGEPESVVSKLTCVSTRRGVKAAAATVALVEAFTAVVVVELVVVGDTRRGHSEAKWSLVLMTSDTIRALVVVVVAVVAEEEEEEVARELVAPPPGGVASTAAVEALLVSLDEALDL